MVNLLFSIHGWVSRGPVLAGLFDSSPGDFWAYFYRNINQQESGPYLGCIGPLRLDRNLHHRETVARYGCDGVAFDPCRSNSNGRNSSRFFSRHRWPKSIWP